MQCCLPKALRSMCRTGCIYRESAFKHLTCPLSQNTDVCAAPCKKPCECTAVKELAKTNQHPLTFPRKSLQ